MFVEQHYFVWKLIASMYLGNVISLILVLATEPLHSVLGHCADHHGLRSWRLLGSAHNSMTDVGLMLVFGALDYLFKKLCYPIAPLVLASVLGDKAKDTFRQSMLLPTLTVDLLVQPAGRQPELRDTADAVLVIAGQSRHGAAGRHRSPPGKPYRMKRISGGGATCHAAGALFHFLSILATSMTSSQIMSRIPDATIIHSRLRLRQLRLILALDELGSLRRAAGEIGMTQPAATKMLHEAEDLLGIELFERLARGMRATPFGETVIYYARMIFAELSGMREELVALESGNLGRVTIGAIPALASGLLTRTIAALKQSHPRLSISLQVDTSDVLVQALQQDQLDVVLGRIPCNARTDDLQFDSLGEEELSVITGAQHPLTQVKEITWTDLQDMTWVLQQHPSPMRTIVNQAFHSARIDLPKSIVETTSIMTLLSLLQQTDMIGITPSSVIEDYPGRHLLAVLPILLEPKLPPYGLITRRNRDHSSAMQTFKAAVHEQQKHAH